MTDYDYDLFVIGAGSGGVRAARMSAQYGARVAVAEEYRVGGTCVIRGCVPKKLFVYASHFAETFEDSEGFGWSREQATFDWPKLLANKDAEIDRLNGIYIRNLKNSGVEIIEERAEIAGPHAVRLASGREVSAKTILIAVGGTPRRDTALPGFEHAITSDEAFHLKTLPKSIMVVGGGYIAVEFAGIFNGMGVETTLVYRGPSILRGFDKDVSDTLHEEMEKKGIKVLTNTTLERIDKTDDGFAVTTNEGAVIAVGQIMKAIGRVPKSDGLGLETVGVKTARNGAILVDEHSRTNVPSIYAVGDVTDRVNLTPVAIREGAAVAETVFNDNPTLVDYSNIPTAVFSQPEIGTVGMSEQEAREHHRIVDIYKSSFRPMKHTLSGRDEKMLMKIVVDGETDKVLGVHLMGPDSGEVIQTVAIAVKMGATKADFDATMALHPSAAEELVTMRTRTERHIQGEEESATV